MFRLICTSKSLIRENFFDDYDVLSHSLCVKQANVCLRLYMIYANDSAVY